MSRELELPTCDQCDRLRTLLEELSELGDALPPWVVEGQHSLGHLFTVLDWALKEAADLPCRGGGQ